MARKNLVCILIVSVISLFLSVPAFSGETLQFAPGEVYWSGACSGSGYVALCGKTKSDPWYITVNNTTDRALTSGTVVFVLIVETRKGDQVLTGATLDFFRKVHVSPECSIYKTVDLGVLPAHGCAYIGNVGGYNSLEPYDVPVFDYQSMSSLDIKRAGLKINWSVSDSHGFTDSGSYIFYPPIRY
jgi:hypothetical protein